VSTAKLLHKLGVDFSVFGENEVCCGSVAMRTGDREAFNQVADKNTELFKNHNITQIVTSCAGCYRTLKKDYGDRLAGIEIYHSAEYLNKIIEERDLKLKGSQKIITYHDPCHLGRHMDFYEPPRDLLNKIASLKEMETIRHAAMCCGAGGGVKKAFPDLSLEMAKNRIKEAEETGAELLISTCPFCFRNLSDAIKALNSDIKMVDLVEFLLKNLDI
jgi:Fe-S oxidoreductase